jgi:hypothetical protein
MRYRELLEYIDTKIDNSLLNQMTDFLVEFIRKETESIVRTLHIERRVELGYHGYKEKAPGHRDYNADEYYGEMGDFANMFDSYVYKKVAVRQSGPLYGAINRSGDFLAKWTNEQVQNWLAANKLTVMYDDAPEVNRVSVMLNHGKHEHNAGEFHRVSPHANGPQSKIVVYINVEYWRDIIRDAIIAEYTSEHYRDIIHELLYDEVYWVFSHEYIHLMQALKARTVIRGTLGYNSTVRINNKKGRGGQLNPVDTPKDVYLYSHYSQRQEIEAHAESAVKRMLARYPNLERTQEEILRYLKWTPEGGRYLVELPSKAQADPTTFNPSEVNQAKNRFLKYVYQIIQRAPNGTGMYSG